MTDRIQEIRARCDTATPGPWEVVDGKSFGVQSENKNIAMCFRPENEHFIAHAREDIPYLLDLLAERERGCEWCTGALPEDITPHREFFKNMLKGWSEDWLCVAKKVPSGEHILHCETDTALTDFSVDIPIRFCPMCGRRLEAGSINAGTIGGEIVQWALRELEVREDD